MHIRAFKFGTIVPICTKSFIPSGKFTIEFFEEKKGHFAIPVAGQDKVEPGQRPSPCPCMAVSPARLGLGALCHGVIAHLLHSNSHKFGNWNVYHRCIFLLCVLIANHSCQDFFDFAMPLQAKIFDIASSWREWRLQFANYFSEWGTSML